MKTWCEHIVWRGFGLTEKGYSDFRWVLHEPNFCANLFSFCPFCGTPKPKEKSLEEKFRNYAELQVSDMRPILKVHAYRLAEIAKEHYEKKS